MRVTNCKNCSFAQIYNYPKMRPLYTYLVALFCATNIYAQTNDDNVIVTDATDTYIFSQKNGNIIVTNERKETYLATRSQANIQPFITYGQGCRLDKARCLGAQKNYKNITSGNVFAGDTKVCYFDVSIERKNKSAKASFVRTYTDVHCFTGISFHNDFFIKDKTIKVIVPQSLKQYVAQGINLPPSVSFKHEKDNLNDVYIFSITNMPKISDDDNCPNDKSGIIITGSFGNYEDLYA